eukprot:TRINITY_DN9390_c0_g1_i2.p1 TRINITY_DN9390_c0_g1~~TRINITY_DN9390_c0_g1_i2.p1  ORF type:complete len:352 (+),score=51.64 TRINITY_DN9390_c0_g1_i2:67-1122(+)
MVYHDEKLLVPREDVEMTFSTADVEGSEGGFFTARTTASVEGAADNRFSLQPPLSIEHLLHASSQGDDDPAWAEDPAVPLEESPRHPIRTGLLSSRRHSPSDGASQGAAPRKPLHAELQRPMPVVLHVYEIDWFTPLLRFVGQPAYHVGVELHNREYIYGTGGIFACTRNRLQPGQKNKVMHGHPIYRQSLTLGVTHLTSKQVSQKAREMKPVWPASAYSIVGPNCQSFAVAFCELLGLGPDAIPFDYCCYARIGILGGYIPTTPTTKVESFQPFQAPFWAACGAVCGGASCGEPPKQPKQRQQNKVEATKKDPDVDELDLPAVCALGSEPLSSAELVINNGLPTLAAFDR